MWDARTALAMDAETFRLAAAREAINHLGLVTKEAEGIIWHMLDFRLTDHPRDRTRAYRKDGEQLSDDEKRAIGVRANGFLSRRAFAEITETGMAAPLEAHETTLLRAQFSVFRYRAIHDARKHDGIPDTYKYDANNMDCPSCQSLDGKMTTGDEACIFAPAECICPTANYGLRLYIDFLAGVV